MQSETVARKRNPDEIRQAIECLTVAEWVRLKKAARVFTRFRPRVGAEDLLQEAITRALEGTRKCPYSVDVTYFLIEAMRSIVDGETDKAEHRLVLVTDRTGEEEATDSAPLIAPPRTPDQFMIEEEDAAVIRGALLALFDDDPVAQVIMEGWMEQMEGEELRDLSGLDRTAYASKRKLIRRRLDQAYPNGWTP